MDNVILVKEIYKRILKRQGLDTVYEENYRNLRNKFNYLMEKVLYRDQRDYGSERKTFVSVKEAPFVEEFLFRATSGAEEDKLFVDWFNGNIETTDYQTIFDLGKKVEHVLEETYNENWDTDTVTKTEWQKTIETALHFDTAINVLKLEQEIERLVSCSTMLTHQISFGSVIKRNISGVRVEVVEGGRETIHIHDKRTVSEIIQECSSQNDYMEALLEILWLMVLDFQEKSINFVKAYAKIKNNFGVENIDDLFEKNALASEYMGFFQSIYDFLNNRPKILDEIEKETNTKNLLEFFKVKDRGRKKK